MHSNWLLIVFTLLAVATGAQAARRSRNGGPKIPQADPAAWAPMRAALERHWAPALRFSALEKSRPALNEVPADIRPLLLEQRASLQAWAQRWAFNSAAATLLHDELIAELGAVATYFAAYEKMLRGMVSGYYLSVERGAIRSDLTAILHRLEHKVLSPLESALRSAVAESGTISRAICDSLHFADMTMSEAKANVALPGSVTADQLMSDFAANAAWLSVIDSILTPLRVQLVRQFPLTARMSSLDVWMIDALRQHDHVLQFIRGKSAIGCQITFTVAQWLAEWHRYNRDHTKIMSGLYAQQMNTLRWRGLEDALARMPPAEGGALTAYLSPGAYQVILLDTVIRQHPEVTTQWNAVRKKTMAKFPSLQKLVPMRLQLDVQRTLAVQMTQLSELSRQPLLQTLEELGITYITGRSGDNVKGDDMETSQLRAELENLLAVAANDLEAVMGRRVKVDDLVEAESDVQPASSAESKPKSKKTKAAARSSPKAAGTVGAAQAKDGENDQRASTTEPNSVQKAQADAVVGVAGKSAEAADEGAAKNVKKGVKKGTEEEAEEGNAEKGAEEEAEEGDEDGWTVVGVPTAAAQDSRRRPLSTSRSTSRVSAQVIPLRASALPRSSRGSTRAVPLRASDAPQVSALLDSLSVFPPLSQQAPQTPLGSGAAGTSPEEARSTGRDEVAALEANSTDDGGKARLEIAVKKPVSSSQQTEVDEEAEDSKGSAMDIVRERREVASKGAAGDIRREDIAAGGAHRHPVGLSGHAFVTCKTCGSLIPWLVRDGAACEIRPCCACYKDGLTCQCGEAYELPAAALTTQDETPKIIVPLYTST